MGQKSNSAWWFFGCILAILAVIVSGTLSLADDLSNDGALLSFSMSFLFVAFSIGGICALVSAIVGEFTWWKILLFVIGAAYAICAFAFYDDESRMIAITVIGSLFFGLVVAILFFRS